MGAFCGSERKILFNDGWGFAKLPLDTGYEEAQKAFFSAVSLPHDWLITQAGDLYESSTGWYTKEFPADEVTGRYILLFDGVYMDTTVYVNGRRAGEWKYGYSAFSVDISDFLKTGTNRIEVSIRHESPNSRWYSGAGIFRDVYLLHKEDAYLVPEGIYVHAEPAKTETAEIARFSGKDSLSCDLSEWKLSVSVETACRAGEEGSLALDLFLYGEEADAPLCTFSSGLLQQAQVNDAPAEAELGNIAGSGFDRVREGWQVIKTFCELTVHAPKLWSPETPECYTLSVGLRRAGEEPQGSACSSETADEEKVTVGFRHIVMSPEEGLFVNGSHTKLNGVCEHHDFGAIGAAFSEAAFRRKVITLKKMGVNAIRSTHNMPARRLLEIADEMGMFIISEAFDMWEKPKTSCDYARFFNEWEERDVASWVRRDRNHPCVILWSIGNEIYDTHAGRGTEITAMLKSQVERHDPLFNARATIGSNYMPWAGAQACADILKIAGYNYAERYYEKHRAEHPDWVIYGSETSSIVQSRGIYHFPLSCGILSDDDLQCSALGNSQTSWGAQSMERCINDDRQYPWSMGQFLWSGFDYIGEPTPYHTRSCYFGQTDTAGFPKDAYYLFKSLWNSETMIHIGVSWDWNPGQMIDVPVMTNCPAAELFVNGVSMGIRQADSRDAETCRPVWRIPFAAGTLKAVGYDSEGNAAAEAYRYSPGSGARLLLSRTRPYSMWCILPRPRRTAMRTIT